MGTTSNPFFLARAPAGGAAGLEGVVYINIYIYTLVYTYYIQLYIYIYHDENNLKRTLLFARAPAGGTAGLEEVAYT